MSPRRRAATGIDLDSVRDGACRDVLERLNRADFDVGAWETTSDIGVPAFFCLIADRRDPRAHHGIGAGAHLAPEIALLRALTEAVQVRTTYISGARDDLLPEEYGDRRRDSWRRFASRLLAERSPARDFGAIADRSKPDFEQDIATLLDLLCAVGVREVIGVDLSKEISASLSTASSSRGSKRPDDHDGYLPGERAARQPEAGA